MSTNKDLVVKMTINSTDFDNGIKNAKTEMNKFSSTAFNAGKSFNSIMSGMIKKIGLVSIALKTVDGFKQFATSTEQMSDNFQNEMGAMKDSWKSLLFQINNGNFQGFQEIIDYARKARQALDELSDAAALFSLDNASTSARATELLSTIQRKKKAGQDYSQEVSDYNALVAQMRQDNSLANKKANEALAGMFGQKGISVGDYGVSYMEAARLARQAAAGAFEDVNVLNRAYNTKVDLDEVSDFSADLPLTRVQQLRRDWGKSRFNRADFLRTLGNIPTADKEAIEKVLTEISQRDNAVASMEKALNRYLQNDNTVTKPTGGSSYTSKSTGLTIDQWIEYYARQMQRVPVPLLPYQDLGIPEEDIIEPETDALVEQVTKSMAELVKQTQEAFIAANALGGAFSALGNLAGDNTFGRITSGMGGIISQAVATTQAMMTLAGAETVEGIADAFANSPGGALTKLALTATALAGILSMISTAKNAFAGSFADGGVVGGSSYSGDKLWARVNSGELIVPYDQWHNGGGNVHFVIEGSQLKGVLDNYESIENM